MYGPLVAGYACAIIVLVAVASRSDRLWPRATHEGGLTLQVVVPLIGAVIVIGLMRTTDRPVNGAGSPGVLNR
jgi:hypothetical protein